MRYHFILLFTEPRCGTHLAMSMLEGVACARHGNTGSFYEPFGGENKPFAKRDGYAEQLVAMADEAAPDKDLHAFAIHWDNLVGTDPRRLVTDLRSLGHKASPVIIERANKFEQYQSTVLAHTTNHWRVKPGEPEPEPPRLAWVPYVYQRWQREQNARFACYRAMLPDAPVVWYELLTPKALGDALGMDLGDPPHLWQKHTKRSPWAVFTDGVGDGYHLSLAIEHGQFLAAGVANTPPWVNRVTALVKTGLRPDHLDRLLVSLARHAPGLRVLVGDDSCEARTPWVYSTIKAFPGLDLGYYRYSEDVGKSAVINSLRCLAETEYFIELDDDFIIDSPESIGLLVDFLDRHPDYQVASGDVYDETAPGKLVRRKGAGSFRAEGDILHVDPVPEVAPGEFSKIDFALNFAVYRRGSIPPMDPTFVIGGDHLDCMWRLRSAGVNIALVGGSAVRHRPDPTWTSQRYIQRRGRGIQGLEKCLRDIGFNEFRLGGFTHRLENPAPVSEPAAPKELPRKVCAVLSHDPRLPTGIGVQCAELVDALSMALPDYDVKVVVTPKGGYGDMDATMYDMVFAFCDIEHLRGVRLPPKERCALWWYSELSTMPHDWHGVFERFGVAKIVWEMHHVIGREFLAGLADSEPPPAVAEACEWLLANKGLLVVARNTWLKNLRGVHDELVLRDYPVLFVTDEKPATALAFDGWDHGNRNLKLLQGPVPHRAMPWLYRCASALLHLPFAEGYGVPVIEALACGTPVITHRDEWVNLDNKLIARAYEGACMSVPVQRCGTVKLVEANWRDVRWEAHELTKVRLEAPRPVDTAPIIKDRERFAQQVRDVAQKLRC